MRKYSIRGAAYSSLLLLLCSSPAILRADNIAFGQSAGFWSFGSSWNAGGNIPQNGVGAAHWNTEIVKGTVYDDVQSVTIDSLAVDSGAAVQVLSSTAPIKNTLNTGILSGPGMVTVQDGATLNVNDPSGFTGTLYLSSAGAITELNLGNGAVLNGNVILGGAPGLAVNVLEGITGTETITNSGNIYASQGVIDGLAGLINTGNIITRPDLPLSGALSIASNSFDNQGIVTVSTGSSLRIDSPVFANLSGSTLASGAWQVSGTLSFAGPSLTTIGPNAYVDLHSEGRLTNDGANNALSTLNLNTGTLRMEDAGNTLTLTSPVFTNAGNLNVDTGATLNLGALQNDPGGILTIGEIGAASVTGTGLLNNGRIYLTSGTADFRSGVLDSFNNLDAATETLSGGWYQLGANATMNYDAGSGAHGGAILNIGAGTSVILSRAGQLQFGPNGSDALALLSSNAGGLVLNNDFYTFTPVNGTFSNTGLLNVFGSSATAHVNGDFVNGVAGSMLLAGSLNVTGALTNNGGIVVDGGAVRAGLALTNTGGIDVDGTLTANNVVNSGALSIQSSSVAGPATGTFSSLFDNEAGGAVTVGTTSGPNIDTLTASSFENNGGDVLVENRGELSVAADYTQDGGDTTLMGSFLFASSIAVQAGTFGGYGLATGDVDNSGGTVDPNGGLFEINGNYTQDADGALEETLGSDSYLDVHGDVTLSGMFDGLSLPGASYALGDSFEILQFDGSLSGDFTGFELPTLGAGLMFQEVRSGDNVMLDVVAGTGPTPTPEPSFSFIAGTLLVGIAGWAKRRRKQSDSRHNN